MVAPGSQWPALSGGLCETSANTNINERALAINYDIQQLIEHVGKGAKVPSVVLEHLKIVREFTVDLMKNPLGAEWRREFADMKQEIMEIRKDMHGVRIATAASKTTESGPRVRSTQAASPSELWKDREIIVKLGDADGIAHFRSMKSSEIKDRAEKARTRAATVSPVLAAIQFVAARQLESGNVSLTLRSAKNAEAARIHRGKWVQHLWKNAEVRLPSWGVVVHDVNVRSLGINRPTELKERQEAVSKPLLTQNLHSWGDAEITHLAWLVLPEGKKSGSMIVEFSSPYVANKAIDCNAIWDSAVLTTVLYDRAARIRQCHRCQKYGHIGRTCSGQPTCVFCAGDHLSPECPGKIDASLMNRKCANCGGAHAGCLKRCPDYLAELDRVKELEMRRERYHRIPAYLSISDPAPRMAGSSSSGSGVSREPVSLDPTPREAASMGSGRGTAKTVTSRSNPVSTQRTSSVKSSKPATATAAKKTVSKPTKPTSVATGGNATSIATRSMASQPSDASIARTPDNQQTRDAECFPMDIDVNIEFDNPAKQAGLYQSKHAPRSEPVRTRSRAAASSQASSQAPSTSTPAIIGKRRKTTAPEGDSEVSWNPPSSSSALAEINSNGSVARKASKPTAPGKENQPVSDTTNRDTHSGTKRKHLEIDTNSLTIRSNRGSVAKKATISVASGKGSQWPIFDIVSRDTHEGEGFRVDISFSDTSGLSNITGSNAEAELTNTPSNE
ncbi:hypothetical protein PENARI_c033G09528 [Penicillium arizonense]|uniref:CCHC-type domain-containing protein n=1 Tax=Penicillium arizonense TaxID=1835702 RepID=A0A1F5L498_PENAI|nr:hypothetical protein PENARI_c033G09528 [Penicillium arizonense]OGE48058.1 hypothetical protein PENARI_c033G09528 [Penicillium arizonense]